MKCKHCGEDLFKGQFRCHKCGMIVEKKEKKSKDKTEENKEDK